MTKLQLFAKVNKEDADLIFDLYERWQEEKYYEDINDYLKVIQQKIPEAYKITGSPFGVICKCTDGDIQITVKDTGDYIKLVVKEL